jgi:serine/threonine protein kinase
MGMSNLVGAVLQGGKYQIEQALGEGGFGVTYRAVRLPINQVVVIKTVNAVNWADLDPDEQQQQFQQEARRLAQCQHPNIVTVTDFFIEQGLPYLVMDYIPGKPLSDIAVPGRPLPEATALYYSQQIGDALQVVHRQGLLHRDVKPQNIMIHDLTGEAILIDFGIARELQSGRTQTHTSIVSDGYAPIEQYLPKARRSEATDVYGLAATLYTLVTGEIPVASVLRSHQPLISPRQIVPHLSLRTEQAILQGMAMELADRPPSIATWVNILQGKSSPHRVSRKPSATSAMATQVVAPRYPTILPNTQAEPGAIAAPPRSIIEPKQPPPHRSRRRRQGNVFSTLASVMTLALLTGMGVGGYQLYQKASQAIQDFRQQPIFQTELPDFSGWVGSLQERLTMPETDQSTPTSADTEAMEPVADANDPEGVPTQESPETLGGLLSRLPLVLSNNGNPSNAPASGNNDSLTAIPGFSPGTAASQVISRLGEPTRQAIQNNFRTAVYDLVPNQASLAYVYDQTNEKIQQVEASFAPSFDRLMMRIALVGMLDGNSTKAIETGLEAVRTRQQNSYRFQHAGFAGTIERNANGYIHIYVRPDGN